MQLHKRISDVLFLGLACAALTGCGESATLERYPRGLFVGNQGGASDVAFAPSPAPVGWEYARLDDSLSLRTPESLAQENAERPSFDQLRRVTLEPRADQVYYFDRPRGRRGW